VEKEGLSFMLRRAIRNVNGVNPVFWRGFRQYFSAFSTWLADLKEKTRKEENGKKGAVKCQMGSCVDFEESRSARVHSRKAYYSVERLGKHSFFIEGVFLCFC
jgi:hypothetical protein